MKIVGRVRDFRLVIAPITEELRSALFFEKAGVRDYKIEISLT